MVSCQHIYKFNAYPTYEGLRQLWKQLNSTLLICENANTCNHDTEDLREKNHRILQYICHIIVKRSKFVSTTPFRWIDGVHHHPHGKNMSGKTSAPCDFFWFSWASALETYLCFCHMRGIEDGNWTWRYGWWSSSENWWCLSSMCYENITVLLPWNTKENPVSLQDTFQTETSKHTSKTRPKRHQL